MKRKAAPALGFTSSPAPALSLSTRRQPLARLCWTAVLVLASASALTPALAQQRGKADSGAAYVSGGVSVEEQDALRAEKSQYSFWLTTAAKGSGAYLADVMVRITDSRSGRVVLEHQMAGPFLMVALPDGNYSVEATVAQSRRGGPETQRTTVAISGKALRQSTMAFDTGDVTEPNPAGGRAAPRP
ncbi:MAG: hypothetical protein LH480_02100 [Rubrivivax sp.]|nr:hypothetical protein [Rubrivivax sp.]